jgi:DNA-binding helix-hairpin-helix protein with protein kinase domain
VIGDLNPKNILVTRKATVYLLDVDSFQVTVDGKTYRCEGGFPEYTPPELQGVAFRDIDRRHEHDCFGLAVVIFQLLFMGRHPFSGRYLGSGEMPLERAIRESRFAYGVDAEARKMRQPPGTLALDSMPSPLVRLFRRAFLTTERPLPSEWIEHLDALAKALKKCDEHSGHYYYNELRECPWCGIESDARVRLFNISLSASDLRRGHFRLDEIWKEIESVKAPDDPRIQWDKILKKPEPSQEVAAFAATRDNRFTIAFIFSVIAGLAIGLLMFTPYLIPLIIAGLIARAIARVDTLGFVEIIEARQRQAKSEDKLLQHRYGRNAGNERWYAKLDELRSQKDTYKNLAQVRQSTLKELEVEAQKNQLEEYLDQFEIKDAEIRGVAAPIKAALLSHGVETAADVGEEVEWIPSVELYQAEKLLEWRRDLALKFVFDPDRGVLREDLIRTERELDSLRFRLESELSGGARRLRQVKQEIEVSRQELQPALTEARQELAQAEKDLEVASKRNSTAVILIALIVASLIGLALRL